MSDHKNHDKAVVKTEPEKSDQEANAEFALGGIVNASNILIGFLNDDAINQLDLVECAKVLHKRVEDVHAGDLKGAETLLTAQASALDAIFTAMAIKAKDSMKGRHIEVTDKCLKLALKAQGQCRATLETLAMIKNPQPYVRQLNQASNMQVNNGAQTRNDVRAGENQKPTNKILEDKRHEIQWLDAGTPQEAIRDDQELETVGENHRAED